MVKPFLANLHSTISKKYSYMYSMTPNFFFYFLIYEYLKNPEFYADFKSVEIIWKKCTIETQDRSCMSLLNSSQNSTGYIQTGGFFSLHIIPRFLPPKPLALYQMRCPLLPSSSRWVTLWWITVPALIKYGVRSPSLFGLHVQCIAILLGPPGCAQNIPLLEPGSPRFFFGGMKTANKPHASRNYTQDHWVSTQPRRIDRCK